MSKLLLLTLMIQTLCAAAVVHVGQDEKVTTCTVIEPVVTVRCGADTYDIRQLSEDPDFDKELKRQWRLVAPMGAGIPNIDAPLTEKPVKAGQEVKAIITADKFQPVGSCDVRWYQAMKAAHKAGERLTLFTNPYDDCQPQGKD